MHVYWQGIDRWTQRPLVSLAAALALSACTTPRPLGPTIAVMPAPGKSFEAFQMDQATCKQYADGQSASTGSLGAYSLQNAYDLAYAQCMYSRSNDVTTYGLGTIAYGAPPRYGPLPYDPQPEYTPQQDVTTTTNPPDERIYAEPETDSQSSFPFGADSNSIPGAFSPAIAHLIRVCNDYDALILKVAHPFGTLDHSAPEVHDSGNIGSVRYTMFWHGSWSKASYVTTIRLTAHYTEPHLIDTLDISVESTTAQYTPFAGSELMKNIALTIIGDRLKDKGQALAAIVVRVFNSNLSVKSALAELLKVGANAA